MDYTKNYVDTAARVDLFLLGVAKEVKRAVTKFPQPNPNLAALTEETGELAKALLHIREGISDSWSDVYTEAVQTAAMACRVALEGDPTILKESPEAPNEI